MKQQTWLAALSALALAGTARAEMGSADQTTNGSMRPEQTQKPGSGKTGSFASNQVTGEISHIDKGAKEVTVKTGDEEKTLTMGDNATVFLEGRLGSFEDLKEGQQVRAAYEPREETKSLRWIEVNPPGGASQTPEKKRTPAPGGGSDDGSNPATGMNTGGTDTGAATTGAAGSGTSGSIDKNVPKGAAKHHQVTGKVVSIDTANRQLVIDHEGRQWTLDVTSKAPVYVEGRKATLGEIREGQQIRASLDPEKTTSTATRIETVPSNRSEKKEESREKPQKSGTK
jgi:Cu/Ag efflux protein CusF